MLLLLIYSVAVVYISRALSSWLSICLYKQHVKMQQTHALTTRKHVMAKKYAACLFARLYICSYIFYFYIFFFYELYASVSEDLISHESKSILEIIMHLYGEWML